MRQKLSDALRRADCAMAGAIFLSLSTVAATAAFNPHSQSAVSPQKVGQPTIQQVVIAEPLAPDILPVPRPRNSVPRMRIEVALENFAGEASCLAEAIYYEARGEGLAGQKAIAEVVVRRSERIDFPHTICGVVHQSNENAVCQFSFVCNGQLDVPKNPTDWARAIRVATRILSGSLPLTNLTEGAISFHALSVQPDWPGMVQTVRIGNHIFYRRPSRGHSI